MRFLKGKLDPTRSYSARWWTWITADGLPVDGVLTLSQQEEKRGTVDEQSYGVCEIAPTSPGYRKFIVRKLGAPIGDETEQYVCQVGPRNSVCSCKAAKCRVEVCRHRSGLEALISVGILAPKELQGA